jgi:hypothetical protein
MSCAQGAMQTRGTCWFFSIINGFLLAENGQKILFESLRKFYKTLSQEEKAYFSNGIDAPCPLKDIIKTKRIYFYKFLDQYLCFMSGPRSINAKAQRSAKILGGASLAGTIAREHDGGQGAYPGEELPKILKHLGITNYMIGDQAGVIEEGPRKRPDFVIFKDKGRSSMAYLPAAFRPASYSLMSCSITIGNSKAPDSTLHKFHAITGFICDKKGYIFDSNQKNSFPCRWWNRDQLVTAVDMHVAPFYSFFKNGQINNLNYNFVIYTKKEFTNKIAPSCLLKYKNVATPWGFNYNNKNLIKQLNAGKFNFLNPAQVAKMKRKISERQKMPVINKTFFNSYLNTVKSKNNARLMIKNLVNSGYRVNKKAQINFENKLNNKFRPTYEEARKMLEAETSKFKRGQVYSKIEKYYTGPQRKELAFYRDWGLWRNQVKKNVTPNLPLPIPLTPPRLRTPSPSPYTKNLKNKFKTYWTSLRPKNRSTLKTYIADYKTPKPKSPSPKKTLFQTPNMNRIFGMVGTLKTAVARKQYYKNTKDKLSKEGQKKLREFIAQKNQNNRNLREAKRFKMIKAPTKS